MTKKKRINQLENLLDWEKEGNRLPQTKNLFNRRISPTFKLVEVDTRIWQLVVFRSNEKEKTTVISTELISHETLIQLGLTILDAIEQSQD